MNNINESFTDKAKRSYQTTIKMCEFQKEKNNFEIKMLLLENEEHDHTILMNKKFISEIDELTYESNKSKM